MTDIKNTLDIPPEGIKTPTGYLYCPPTQGKQILFVIAAFFTAIFLGLFIGGVAGFTSELASGFLCFVFLLTFFLGYGLWVSFVSALAFSSIKWPIIKVLMKLFIKKKAQIN